MSPRIAILGAGANGASLGADLTAAGLDVTLIEQWPAHVEAMRADGLRVVSPDGDLHVRPHVLHLCEVAELRRPFDVVLMLMKAYDTPWAARLIEPYLAGTGILVGVQNGMTAPEIADVVGAERTLGCVIECSATMTDPGVIHRHTGVSRSWFALGALRDGPVERVEEVRRILAHAGTVAVTTQIAAAKWMKLVSNCTLLVPSALLGLPMLDALHVPGFRRVMVAAGEEALAVGEALGHETLPIFGLDEDDLRDPRGVVEVMTDRLFSGFVVPGATTTVLQDWTKGRHSEVDDLNGEVVTHGVLCGIPTPVNAAVVRLALDVEQGRRMPAPDLVDEMLAAVDQGVR